MRKKILLFLPICLIFMACENREFRNIYSQDILTEENCKNFQFAAWALLVETGIKLDPEQLEMVVTDYRGGVPLQIAQYPIYYVKSIDENKFEKFKSRFSTKLSDWKYFEENQSLHFLIVNKHDLSCKIDKEKIVFGFRNIDVIAP